MWKQNYGKPVFIYLFIYLFIFPFTSTLIIILLNSSFIFIFNSNLGNTERNPDTTQSYKDQEKIKAFLQIENICENLNLGPSVREYAKTK